MKLRDYQLEALRAWKGSGERGVVVMPTGTGKTYVALAAIREELQRGGSVAVIVPTIVLAHQWKQKLREVGVACALYYGEEKALGRVTVFVLNSAFLNMRLLNHFSLIVIDEVHHLNTENGWGRLLDHLSGKRVLGLTATPDPRVRLKVAYRLGVAAARARGALSDVQVIPYVVSLTPSERARLSRIEDELRRVARALEHARHRNPALAAELEHRLKVLANRRKQLMSEVEAKKDAVLEIARSHPGERVLVFCESIRGAEGIRRHLVEHGVRAAVYHSKLNGRGRAVLSEWGKSYQVLVAVRALDEGVDVPECGTGVIVATGKSDRQLIQRIGRVLRFQPGKVARIYVVVGGGTYEVSILAKIRRLVHAS